MLNSFRAEQKSQSGRSLFSAVVAVAALATAVPVLADSGGKPLATRDLDVDGVVAEVIESVRKDNVLTVRVRFRNTGDEEARIDLLRQAGNYDVNYIIAGDTKYNVMRDQKKNVIASPMDGGGWVSGTIKPKGKWFWWAKFPAPPPDQTSYTLYLNVGPPIEDVPIIDAPASRPKEKR
jgi:hypothetical protein